MKSKIMELRALRRWLKPMKYLAYLLGIVAIGFMVAYYIFDQSSDCGIIGALSLIGALLIYLIRENAETVIDMRINEEEWVESRRHNKE